MADLRVQGILRILVLTDKRVILTWRQLMIAVEKIREWIIRALVNEPVLGQNYVDWHTEKSGECGVTIMYPNEQFEIIIRRK